MAINAEIKSFYKLTIFRVGVVEEPMNRRTYKCYVRSIIDSNTPRSLKSYASARMRFDCGCHGWFEGPNYGPREAKLHLGMLYKTADKKSEKSLQKKLDFLTTIPLVTMLFF